MIDAAVKKSARARLKRIEGQIRGITRMVEEEKYCIDIINQIAAAESALRGVSKIILKRHVESCVTGAILDGEGQNLIDELIETVFKYGKK